MIYDKQNSQKRYVAFNPVCLQLHDTAMILIIYEASTFYFLQCHYGF